MTIQSSEKEVEQEDVDTLTKPVKALEVQSHCWLPKQLFTRIYSGIGYLFGLVGKMEALACFPEGMLERWASLVTRMW